MDTFAYIFQSPGNISNDMELIDDDNCLWEIRFCKVTVNLIHVRNKVADFLFVWKFIKILHKGYLSTRGKNVKYLMSFGIGKDCLKFLSAGIAFKFIYGQNPRKKGRFWVTDIPHPTEDKGVINTQKSRSRAYILAGFQ